MLEQESLLYAQAARYDLITVILVRALITTEYMFD